MVLSLGTGCRSAISTDTGKARHGERTGLSDSPAGSTPLAEDVVVTSDGLFHIDRDGRLASLTVTPYAAEDVLQELLETHPDLLAGGQMTPGEPRRWSLIRREHGVPDRESATGSRWSVDHLFVDQDAVPTLVEVKRSSDTRIRREVVGQMLDYAANGVRYWPLVDLRSAFEATQLAADRDPTEQLAELTNNEGVSLDEFFARVGDNLRAGRIRMVFLADVVPDELRRITEFLNEQMNPAEVYAVEVRTYRAEGHEGMVIVPTVFGRTAAASAKTAVRTTPDRTTLLERSQPATLEMLDRFDALAADLGLVVHQTPAGALLKTRARASVANVYLADYDSVDVPLKPLRDRGWLEEADSALLRLQAMTAKRLTEKTPTLPASDALRHWNELRPILVEIAQLYLTREANAGAMASK